MIRYAWLSQFAKAEDSEWEPINDSQLSEIRAELSRRPSPDAANELTVIAQVDDALLVEEEEKVHELPADEKKQFIESAKVWSSLAAEVRHEVRTRATEFQKQPPERKETLLSRYEAFQALTSEQQAKIVRRYRS